MRILRKRTLRHLAVFLLLLIAPAFAVGICGVEELTNAGFYMPETDPVSTRVAEYLLQNGFVSCQDSQRMYRQVLAGELDCAVVFPEGFAQMIAQGALEGSIVFYVSPSSYAPDLFRNHVAAAVYKEYVPYISAKAFEGTGITETAVLAMYEEMFAQGHVFSFDVLTVSGAAMPEDPQGRSMAMGAAAILLSTVLFALSAETVERTFYPMLGRLGLQKSLKTVLLPQILADALMAAVFGGAGLAVAGFGELFFPTCVYALLIATVGLTLTLALPKTKQMYILLPALVIGGVALCPIYIDLGLLLPAVRGIRWLLPAYWLWEVTQRPVLWLLPAAASCLLGYLVLLLRFGILQKHPISWGKRLMEPAGKHHSRG